MGGRGSGSMSLKTNDRYSKFAYNSFASSNRGLDPTRMTGNPAYGFASAEFYNRVVRDDWSESSRSFRYPQTKKMGKIALALDVEFDKQSYNGKIYRGLAVSKERYATFKVGATIDMNGMSSWTKSQSVAKGFAGERNGEFVVFEMPKGTKHGADIQHLSRYSPEQEVALSSKSRQRITNVRKKGDFTFVTVEEI